MPQASDDKLQTLRAQRTLHPHPERVTDPLFQADNPFFDPRDLVQVKYEMLRRVELDRHSVVQASRAFGFSRPIFYEAHAAYERGGLAALQRARPGPRRRHKLKPEVLAFLQQARADRPRVGARQLAKEVQERFQMDVHPRSIERALGAERAKGGHSPAGSTMPS